MVLDEDRNATQTEAPGLTEAPSRVSILRLDRSHEGFTNTETRNDEVISSQLSGLSSITDSGTGELSTSSSVQRSLDRLSLAQPSEPSDLSTITEEGSPDVSSVEVAAAQVSEQIGNQKFGEVISAPCIPYHESEETDVQDDDGSAKEEGGFNWSLLPQEIWDYIVARLPFNEVFQHRLVDRSAREVIKRGTFQQSRARHSPTEFSLSPTVFFVKNGIWNIIGYDSCTGGWRSLPPLICLPAPDPDLFKDFLVVGHFGLLCVNVGKAQEAEELIICNPLTFERKVLRSLHFPRHPVVLCVTVAKNYTYSVIAIGSAAIGTEALSKKTEVYYSTTEEWVVAGDVPGADFSVNDYQNGVFCEKLGLFLCVGFLSIDGKPNGKGVLAFDVEKRLWLEDWQCSLPQPPAVETGLTVYFAITQLLECNDVIYLFSEQEAGRYVTHCIDRLDLDGKGGFKWTRMVTRSRQGNRALLVYPEFTCVPLGENKLCIFNTIERTGVLFVMKDDPKDITSEPLPPPPAIKEDGILFHSLNPISYAFEPSFGVRV